MLYSLTFETMLNVNNVISYFGSDQLLRKDVSMLKNDGSTKLKSFLRYKFGGFRRLQRKCVLLVVFRTIKFTKKVVPEIPSKVDHGNYSGVLSRLWSSAQMKIFLLLCASPKPMLHLIWCGVCRDLILTKKTQYHPVRCFFW